MSRVLKNKDLMNTRLATNYGGWMYCEKCGENIGYLCYSTYDRLELNYKCNCGSIGSATLDFIDSGKGETSKNEMLIIKNRFCCPKDNEPLITILENKVANYNLRIMCKTCGNVYKVMKK